METDRSTPTPQPGDGDPADDAPDYREMAPDTDTSQDPVEKPDADREPGHTKS